MKKKWRGIYFQIETLATAILNSVNLRFSELNFLMSGNIKEYFKHKGVTNFRKVLNLLHRF